MVEVRIARRQDRQDVARVLAVAFRDDPVMRWLLPTGARRDLLFRTIVRWMHGPLGGSDVAEDPVDGQAVGASLWDPPGHRQQVRHALASYAPFTRALRTRTPYALALESAFHKNRPPGTFWYLAMLGAAVQGQGVGSALLEHRLARIEGPAYLENSNERNTPLYERFGFRVTGEIRLPHGGPTCWPMYRD